MIIDIKDITPEGKPVEGVVTLSVRSGERDEPLAFLPVRVSGLLSRGSRGVDFEGEIEGGVSLACVRCLEPFEFAVNAEFRLVFVPGGSPKGSRESQVQQEDCDLYPVEGFRVELGEVVREQVYLNLPLKPLCREGCAGLCPVCGANRNLAPCDCREKEVDAGTVPVIHFPPR